jgi:CDP-paratose 2-epimerase
MVRDAIHSHDLVSAFEAFHRRPRVAEVYNMGGGRFSNCSHLEAFQIAAEITGLEARTDYVEENRVGDHQWWISGTARFEAHYPTGSSPTTCRPSCARCTRRTRTSGKA